MKVSKKSWHYKLLYNDLSHGTMPDGVISYWWAVVWRVIGLGLFMLVIGWWACIIMWLLWHIKQPTMEYTDE